MHEMGRCVVGRAPWWSVMRCHEHVWSAPVWFQSSYKQKQYKERNKEKHSYSRTTHWESNEIFQRQMKPCRSIWVEPKDTTGFRPTSIGTPNPMVETSFVLSKMALSGYPSFSNCWLYHTTIYWVYIYIYIPRNIPIISNYLQTYPFCFQILCTYFDATVYSNTSSIIKKQLINQFGCLFILNFDK